MGGSRLAWTGDVSLGAWIAPRLGPLDGRVGSVVPRGFPAYARVLHPVEDRDGEPSTWAAVCEATGRTPHALMQWHAISSPPVEDGSGHALSRGRAWDGREPQEGRLEPVALDRLCRVLASRADPTVECCFALWEGYGWIHGSPSVVLFGTSPGSTSTEVPPAFDAEVVTGPRLHHPGRDYLLFTGPLEAATDLGWWPTPDWFDAQSPNLFWPTDQSWCIGTEIDFDSTLVAGSTALIGAVLAEPGLEAWPVQPGDALTMDGDSVNV